MKDSTNDDLALELVIPPAFVAYFMYNAEGGSLDQLEGWLCGEVVVRKQCRSAQSGDMEEKHTLSYVVSDFVNSSQRDRMNESLPITSTSVLGWFSTRRGSRPLPSLLERAHIALLPLQPAPVLLLVCCDTGSESNSKSTSLLAFCCRKMLFSPIDLVFENVGTSRTSITYAERAFSSLPARDVPSSLRNDADSLVDQFATSATKLLNVAWPDILSQ